jgi:hemoglobin
MNHGPVHPADPARIPGSRATAGGSRLGVDVVAVAAIRPTVAPADAAGTAPNPHFDRIGGAAAIARLTELFYRHMDTLPEARPIRAMHPADLSRSRQTLYRYLVGWMGGPPLYASQNGPPRLRHKHLSFAIGDAERDAWMNCMQLALDEVVADEALRREIAAAFRKTATFLRNR